MPPGYRFVTPSKVIKTWPSGVSRPKSGVSAGLAHYPYCPGTFPAPRCKVSVVAHWPGRPSETQPLVPAPNAGTRSPGQSRPGARDTGCPSSFSVRTSPCSPGSSSSALTPAAQQGGNPHRPRSQGARTPATAPIHVLQPDQTQSSRPGPLPSCGSSVARPAVAIKSADLARCAASLNNRPRKTLGYMKPSEKLAALLAHRLKPPCDMVLGQAAFSYLAQSRLRRAPGSNPLSGY